MLQRFLLSACVFSVLLLLIACTPDPDYPIEPSIEFVSFTKVQNNTGIDDKGTLEISFIDGDGDIGLSEYDTDPPYDTASIYYYNFFITYYEKQHGVYVKVDLPLTNDSRIPLTPPAEEGLPLKGDIDIDLYINNPFSTFDTIKFDAYIVDRALHESNTITTPDIIIDKH
jgi:hypothetical protein